VLIASHVLTEIEQIANRVMILLDGRLLTSDALTQGAQGQRLRLQVVGTEQAVRDCVGAVPGVRSIATESAGSTGPASYLVDADARPQLAQELAAALVGHGFALHQLTLLPPDLERIFLDLTRYPREAAA
jgi:ABC-2 type transport system ATP-binding protein